MTATTVRVGVCADDRRVDLVLPAAVPVADLVPELARDLGVLDATGAHRRLRLVTPAGTCLQADLGLAPQGVADGQLLSLVPDSDVGRDRYDDLAEAMATIVTRELPAWDPSAARRAAQVAGALLAALGALAFVVGHTSAALREAAIALTVAMALLTVAGAAAPAAAVAVSGLRPDVPVDLDRLAADAASAHRVLLALTGLVGVAPGLVAPLAVGLGPAGAATALVCALLVTLRTRGFRSRSVVAVGLATGVASLVSVAASVLVIEVAWRTEVALALLLVGAVAYLLPVGSTLLRRLADVLETACLVAVPPLLVVTTGLPAHLPG